MHRSSPCSLNHKAEPGYSSTLYQEPEEYDYGPNELPTRTNRRRRMEIGPFVRRVSTNTSNLRSGDRPRISLHRMLNSLFGVKASPGTSVTITPHGAAHRNPSSSDRYMGGQSGYPLATSTFRNSSHSVDIIGPRAFLFSGPELQGSEGDQDTTNQPRKSTPSLYTNDSRVSADVWCHLETSGSLVDELILEPLTRPAACCINQLLDDSFHSLELAPHLPRSVMSHLLRYLDLNSFKALRQTCKAWNSTLNVICPPKFPSVYRLPTEIIQHIYTYLVPVDFDAARHTCRSWMIASLDRRRLLVTMLKRGGWWSSTELDLIERKRRCSMEREEWFLSQILARECALSGNAVDPRIMVPTARVDFADLRTGYPGPIGRHNAQLVFNFSICCRYLLVADGGMIYIYSLEGNNLHPLTSVVCPRKVLAMSMDASCRRFAVAALLDGRMGLMCDLRAPHMADFPIQPSQSHSPSTLTRRLSPSSTLDQEKYDMASSSGDSTMRSGESSVDSIEIQNNMENTELHQASDESTHEESFINRTWNLRIKGHPGSTPSMPLSQHIPYRNSARPIRIETGARSMYRHLCSTDDPPRSVAICPRRRCVAFGCSAGVELHWVDALTGNDFNRWFPLTAPSDFLYFMPPRRGLDSAKKLRLISSASHPDIRPTIFDRLLAARPNLSLFWDSVGLQHWRLPSEPWSERDHYHAVPLGDGHHCLFTDPGTGMLCLGSDAPVGGPAKLLRRIMFYPPYIGAIPSTYAACADISWGARIVAGFGYTVVLYSVPPDVFSLSALEQNVGSDLDPTSNLRNEGENIEWIDWWPEQNLLPNRHSNETVWPLHLRGVQLGEVESLVNLAINNSSGLAIWAIGANGQATVWQIDDGSRPSEISNRNVMADGNVMDVYETDGDGDVLMKDEERSVNFDGNCSVPFKISRALTVENDNEIEIVKVPYGAFYDEGDVIMTDIGADDERSYVEGRVIDW